MSSIESCNLQSAFLQPLLSCQVQKKVLSEVEKTKIPESELFFRIIIQKENRSWVKTHEHFVAKYLKKITKFSEPRLVDLVHCIHALHFQHLEPFESYSEETMKGLLAYLHDGTLPTLPKKVLFDITILSCQWKITPLFKAILCQMEKESLEEDFKARLSKLGPKAMRKVANMYLTFFDKNNTDQSLFWLLFKENMIDHLVQKGNCKEKGFILWFIERYSCNLLLSKEGSFLIEVLAQKHPEQLFFYEKEIEQHISTLELCDSIISHGRFNSVLLFLIQAKNFPEKIYDIIYKIIKSTCFQALQKECIFSHLHGCGYFTFFDEKKLRELLIGAIFTEDVKFIRFFLDFLVEKCQMKRASVISILNQNLIFLLQQKQSLVLSVVVDFLQNEVKLRFKAKKSASFTDVLAFALEYKCDSKKIAILLKHVNRISNKTIHSCLKVPFFDSTSFRLILSKSETSQAQLAASIFIKNLENRHVDTLFALFDPQQFSDILVNAAKILRQRESMAPFIRLYKYAKLKKISIPYTQNATPCHPLKNRLLEHS